LGEGLVIVGGGPDLAPLLSLAGSLGIADHVHFVGHQANPFPLMKRARAYVLSSVWEGFGLALLEAMTLGVPAIATDCPSGPGEILNGGAAGPLVPIRDAEALAAAMVKVCTSDAEHARYAALARARSEHYSLQAMAAGYRDLIRRVTRAGP
jgi:glycosyltransferase involved in cell wall biosynthesis